MKTQTIELLGCRFGKHGIRHNGGYFKASYSHCTLVDGREAITIYGHSTTGRLPVCLNPENGTDMMTDYFESDKVRFFAGSHEFRSLLPLTQGGQP